MKVMMTMAPLIKANYTCKIYQWMMSFSVLSLLICLLILPYSLHALSMIPSSLHQLSQKADWIILATPTHQKTIQVKHRLITQYTVIPHAYLKGKLGTSLRSSVPPPLSFHFLGGQLNQIQQRIPGLVPPPLNQPLLLFLKCTSPTQCKPLGWNQGTWGIEKKTNIPSPHELLTESYLFKPLLESNHLHWINPQPSIQSKIHLNTPSDTSQSHSQLNRPLSKSVRLSLSTLALLLNQTWTLY